jgi:hypothetical protein
MTLQKPLPIEKAESEASPTFVQKWIHEPSAMTG